MYDFYAHQDSEPEMFQSTIADMTGLRDRTVLFLGGYKSQSPERRMLR